MTAPRLQIEPGARRRAQELANRTVSDDELRAALGVPLSAEERAETLALVDWFCRRYPTPADRLRYVRRAHARWTRHQR
jgi:hypothetical protein